MLPIPQALSAQGLRRPRDLEEEKRTGFIELFFDLVFVVVVTQIATALTEDLSIAGAGRARFLLLVA